MSGNRACILGGGGIHIVGDAEAITNTAAATVREMAALFCDALRSGVEYADPDIASNEERYRQRVLNTLTRPPDH
ncbi:hypothetical protein [Cupriavidus basilensis]|uniref:hypothetical protein n=1 Tax=Cupriavidus basilensis TaxID=68895 RepID=UPI0039F6600A